MAHTDTSEKGLENLIVESLVNDAGYVGGNAADFDRDHALDWPTLLGFLSTTQPEKVAKLDLDTDGPKRTKFLARLTGEIAKRGVVDVLRRGVSDGPVSLDLFYGTPHPGNAAAVEKYTRNVFTVARQVRYSPVETTNSLDVVIFINGLPVATFELKNRLTKQTVFDAVQQYKNDRDPRERLFEFGRCL
ncbi:MAG: type I restriction endonuclease, partial [Phycisphaerales bacterium]